jgi:hypothetical protein
VSSVLSSLHIIGARAVLIFAVALALWGTYLYFRRRAVSPGFRSSFLIMAGLTVVQGLAGAAVFLTGHHPTELLHVVYGIFAAIFLPGVYLWAHGGSSQREAVILAGAAWIVSIAFLRGFATG